MKNIKKLIPVLMAILMIATFSGCTNEENKEENKVKYIEKNPIVTMAVEYTNADGQKAEGTIKMELYPNKAPIAVANYVNLINNKFYDGLTFHRIRENFMIQGGDPLGTGAGGAKLSDLDKSVERGSDKDYKYSVKGEFALNGVNNDTKYEPGTLAMARGDYSNLGLKEEGYNSGGSQFFIVNTDKQATLQSLQDNYTAFGKVIEGYDVVLAISKTEVEVASNGEKSKPKSSPVIKSMTVDTFGENYAIPEVINADETTQKVQKRYLELLQQYYGK